MTMLTIVNRDRGAPAPRQPGAGAAAGAGAGAGAGAAPGGPGGQLQQLREVCNLISSVPEPHSHQLVQENPALIQPLLQQIATQNPELAQLMSENPEALYELLSGAGEGDDDDDPMGQQEIQVNLTQEEAAAVERVGISLNWSKCESVVLTPARAARLRSPACASGIHALRQERGTRCQLPVRAGRGGHVIDARDWT